MDKQFLKLAIYFLKEYSEQLSNNSCNDPSKEVADIIKEIGDENFEKIAEKWNNGECEGAGRYDWIIASVTAYKIEQILKGK